MARRQAADYAAKQQRIRNGAAELFAHSGFAATSIADIAQACGVAKSLVYHYFDSKEEILYDLLSAHMDALLAAAEEALSVSDEPERQFREFVRAHLRLYAHARAKHILLLNGLSSLPPQRRKAIVARERRLIAMAADLLARLAPGVAARPDLRMPAAMSFYGLINWTYTWYRADGKMAPEEFADMAAEIILRGLPAAVAQHHERTSEFVK
jgi:AcrR family transcriptional regulator